MKDTLPEMEARYRDMLMQRSGEERLKMGCAMRETARALVEASIREQDPQATPEAVRKVLFLRFYGHEFDVESRDPRCHRVCRPSRCQVTDLRPASRRSYLVVRVSIWFV